MSEKLIDKEKITKIVPGNVNLYTYLNYKCVKKKLTLFKLRGFMGPSRATYKLREWTRKFLKVTCKTLT